MTSRGDKARTTVHNMEEFYFSLAAGSQIKTARNLEYPFILINFMTKTNKPPKYPYRRLFIDSGGFYSSMTSRKYIRTDDEYLQYVEKIMPDYFALRDYPCEPELLKKHGLTVKQNIQRTVDNHITLLDMLPNYCINAQPVPVIQGWEASDYIDCIDAFQDQGLMSNYMAIGSVCRRTAVRNIQKIIVSVRDAIPSWIRLHGFGIKLTALKDLAIYNALYSVDSGAWDYQARWKKFRGEEEDLPHASYNAAVKYIAKIDRIHAMHRGQTYL